MLEIPLVHLNADFRSLMQLHNGVILNKRDACFIVELMHHPDRVAAFLELTQHMNTKVIKHSGVIRLM